MSHNRSHEKLAMLRRPASPGMCVPYAGFSSHTESIPSGGRGRRIPACGAASVFFMPGLSFHTPSASHSGVRIHNSKSWLVVDSTSGRSATSRPAAGFRPLHPLISIPDAAHAATDRIVVRHKMKFSRTPERWTHTVPGTGFASLTNRQSLLLVKSNTL